MAIIKKIKLPNETNARDIGALSSNVIYDGDSGVTTTLNEKIQSIFTAIGDINSFEIALVNTLPTEDIDDHTIYFVPNAQDANVRDEYMYVGNTWEMIGSTTIDLSDYPTYDDITVTQGLTTGIPAATITVGATTTTIYSNNKQIWLGTSSTSVSVANKVATCEGLVLEPGCIVGIKFTNGSKPSASYTLNVNNTGAFPIKFNEGALLDLYVRTNETVFFQYRDTGYVSGKSWTFLFKERFTDQEVYYGYSSTAAATKAKIVTTSGILYDFNASNKLIVVKFTNENTNDSPTLRTSDDRVNYNIEAINEGDLYWKANDTVVFITNSTTARILYVVKSIPSITVTQGLTTGITIGTITVDGTTSTLYAPEAITPPTYSLSMTGATITLLADNVAASTITLPIYDGTVV